MPLPSNSKTKSPPRATITNFQPGQHVTVARAGDIVLVRDYTGGSDVLGSLIMAGQRARYGNTDYARWTHCFIVVDNKQSNTIVEALSQGVVTRDIGKYNQKERLLIQPYVGSVVRDYACRYALAQVGQLYGKLDFASLAFALLTNLKWSLNVYKHPICSQLVGSAVECYTDSGFPIPPEADMPADLGAYWGAQSGEPLPPLSFLGHLLDVVKIVAWAISPWKSGLKPT